MAYGSGLGRDYGGFASVIRANSSQHANSSLHAISSQHTIDVPDAELLFKGEFRRAGPDLVLTGQDGRHHIFPGYFSSAHPQALAAPNGASLSAELVGLLAGSVAPGQYAQAQPATPPQAIGKVEKVVGNVTVVRNGVAVALHVGDPVFKSDVIQTGGGSSVGIAFPDGTALNLIANTRMALNDYSYDSNSTSNEALFSLVQGTFSFVAGQVAHTGFMRISTPVATIGIRGTTGIAQQVTADLGDVRYGFLVANDQGVNSHGGFALLDEQGNEIGFAGDPGTWVFITKHGSAGTLEVRTAPVSDIELPAIQGLIGDVFHVLNLSNTPRQPSPGNNGSSTPNDLIETAPQHINYNGGGTTEFVNTGLYIAPAVLPGAVTGTSLNFVTPPTGNTATSTVFWVGGSGNWDDGSHWSDNLPPGPDNTTIEILNGVKVTISDSETAETIVVGSGSTLNIVSGGSLTVTGSIDNSGTVQLNSSGSDPALPVSGTVTLTGGGTFAMEGPADEIYGVSASAVLDNVDNTIVGSGVIGQGDGLLTLINRGTIEAAPLLSSDSGTLTIDTGNVFNNYGTLEATAGGTLQTEDVFINFARGVALSGGTMDFTGGIFNGAGATIEALGGGSITIDIVNESGTWNSGLVETFTNGTINIKETNDTNLTNRGTIEADGGTINITHDNADTTNLGTLMAVDGGTIHITNFAHGGTGGNAGTQDADGGTIIHDGGATNLTGGTMEAVDGGQFEINLGLINQSGATAEALDGGTFTIDSTGVQNMGMLEADGGTLTVVGGIANTGDARITDGGTLNFESVVSSGQTVTFAGPGTLKLGDPAGFAGKIAGIEGTDDVLDLKGFNAATTTATTGSRSYNSNDNITALRVHDSSDNVTVILRLVGDYSASTWTPSDDGHGGVDIVDPPAPPSGSAKDFFVFHPDLGSSLNSTAAQQDGSDFSHARNVQWVHHFAAEIVPEPHDHAPDEFGSADALHGVDAARLHAILQSAVHLH